MMQLLHDRSGEPFDDPISTANYTYQQRRIAQLKQELKDVKQQQRKAKRMVPQPVLLHRHPTR